MVLGSIISAVAGLIGGSRAAGAASSATMDANASNRQINRENIAMQKLFAQEGIRWKVADAKAAGIHPLYALGANTVSFQPSSIGAIPDMSKADKWNALRDAGQDIGRAISAKQTTAERLQERLLLAQIEGQEIENASKASDVARKFNPTQQPPPMPSLMENYIDPHGNAVIGKSMQGSQALEDMFLSNLYNDFRFTFPSMMNSEMKSIKRNIKNSGLWKFLTKNQVGRSYKW